MHPSLYKLMALTSKSNLRRLFRGARSVRGAFLIIFTIGFFAMMLVPSVLVAFTPTGRQVFPSVWLSPICRLVCSPSACSSFSHRRAKGPSISAPPEVDFLFPAPFHRRELLDLQAREDGGRALVHGFDLFDVFPDLSRVMASRRSSASS